MTAMTAATIDLLTGGRFMLASEQAAHRSSKLARVVYGKLLRRTREYVEIIRTILKREQPLEHHGEYYDIPVRGERGSASRSSSSGILCVKASHLVAAIGPKNVALAAEIADGCFRCFLSASSKTCFARHSKKASDAGATERLSPISTSRRRSLLLSAMRHCLPNADQAEPRLYVGGIGRARQELL